jgi:hypothetical protein
MAVYVDRSMWEFHGRIMCHMLADSEAELHAMADRIGKSRNRYQRHASTPHYDVDTGERALAVRLGAIEIDRRKTVQIIRAIRDNPDGFFVKKQRTGQASFDF